MMGREKSMKKTICLRRITFEPDVRDKEERGMNMRVRGILFFEMFWSFDSLRRFLDID